MTRENKGASNQCLLTLVLSVCAAIVLVGVWQPQQTRHQLTSSTAFAIGWTITDCRKMQKCKKTKRRILIFFRKLLSYLNLFSVLQFSKERESKQSCTVYSKFWFAVFCVHEINSFLNFTIFFWCFLKCDFLHPGLLKYINRYTRILYIITKLTMYTISQYLKFENYKNTELSKFYQSIWKKVSFLFRNSSIMLKS